MDVGIYSNLFQVHWDFQEVEIMQIERGKFSDLRVLRNQLLTQQIDAQVYALEAYIYGYGQQQADLEKYGFVKKVQSLNQPELVSRLILEGFIVRLASAGYTCNSKFGRAIAFQLSIPLLSLPNGVKLFRGVEIVSQFLFDREDEKISYFIIVDPVFKYYDQSNHSLSTHEVVIKFGSDTLKQLRTKQGDFAPTGGINLEVSRQRFADYIIPFINTRHEFTLPCWATKESIPYFGIPAQIDPNPMRIILAE